MPSYGPMGYGSFPYMPQSNYQGGVQPNFYQNNMNPQTNQYAFVNGIEGAKSFQVQPNQTMLLMDSDNPIVYMKQANNLGQSTLRYFRLQEISENDIRGNNNQTQQEYALKSDLDALNQKIEELTNKIGQ